MKNNVQHHLSGEFRSICSKYKKSVTAYRNINTLENLVTEQKRAKCSLHESVAFKLITNIFFKTVFLLFISSLFSCGGNTDLPYLKNNSSKNDSVISYRNLNETKSKELQKFLKDSLPEGIENINVQVFDSIGERIKPFLLISISLNKDLLSEEKTGKNYHQKVYT